MIRTNIIHNGQQVVPGITHIFARNYTEKCLRDLLEIQELTDIILFVLLMHTKKSTYYIVMTAAAVGVLHYYQIKQHKHWSCLVQPYILLLFG